MKVYLDDERPTPAGWVSARWPYEVIDLLKTGQVTEMSLDHDLGDDDRGTGYDVLKWLEEEVARNNFVPPLIMIYTSNVSARRRMELAGGSIKRFSNR